jgi:hypothetical protein
MIRVLHTRNRFERMLVTNGAFISDGNWITHGTCVGVLVQSYDEKEDYSHVVDKIVMNVLFSKTFSTFIAVLV